MGIYNIRDINLKLNIGKYLKTLKNRAKLSRNVPKY